MGELLSRRQFMSVPAVAGGVVLAGGLVSRAALAAVENGWPALPPVKIHVVYVGLGGAWPKPEFGALGGSAKFNVYLRKVQERPCGVDCVGGRLIRNRVDAAAESAAVGDANAVLVVRFPLGNGQVLARDLIAHSSSTARRPSERGRLAGSAESSKSRRSALRRVFTLYSVDN